MPYITCSSEKTFRTQECHCPCSNLQLSYCILIQMLLIILSTSALWTALTVIEKKLTNSRLSLLGIDCFAFSISRTPARTSKPCPSSSFTILFPVCPVAPATKTILLELPEAGVGLLLVCISSEFSCPSSLQCIQKSNHARWWTGLLSWTNLSNTLHL